MEKNSRFSLILRKIAVCHETAIHCNETNACTEVLFILSEGPPRQQIAGHKNHPHACSLSSLI